MAKKKDLDTLRQGVRNIDDQLLKLMKQRIDLAKQIGDKKYQLGLPVKNFQVEKEVIEKSRKRAEEIGLYSDLAEEFAKLKIRYAVMAQEEHHSKSRISNQASEKKVTIVGGAGGMGRWFAQFFDSIHHQITIVDPNISSQTHIPEHFKVEAELEAAVKKSDYVILATPIPVTGDLISQIAEMKTEAIVFDISSLKSPLLQSITDASKKGLKITSIHPMFGPGTDLLSGQNIILCDVPGNELQTDELATLFSGTTASVIKMPIDEHDALMSYVLGLSHMLNLVFAKTISDSTVAFEHLSKVASSTFKAQLDVALPVLNENQDLYFEIQKNNEFTSQVTKDLLEKIQDYLKSVESGNREEFKQYMQNSKKYFDQF